MPNLVKSRVVSGARYGRPRLRGVVTVTATIERGYFSVTAAVHRKGFPGQEWAGGCLHEDIARLWPELAPLIALHLRGTDGVPMHVEANGVYWIAGACGGIGRQYHGGNGSSARTPDECLAIAARHFGCDMAEAAALRDAVSDSPLSAAEIVAEFCARMRPIWRAAAAEAIAAFNLGTAIAA